MGSTTAPSAAPSAAAAIASIPDSVSVSRVVPGAPYAASSIPSVPLVSRTLPYTPPRISATVAPEQMPNDVCRIVTPLRADVWEAELRAAGLLERFHSVPNGLRNGFDIGFGFDDMFAPFSESNPFIIMPNHKPTLENPEVIEKMLEEETAEGRISGFYDPEELFKLVGNFRTTPLTIAPKNGSYAEGRVCQDFSFPRDDPSQPSLNSVIDMDNFKCDWGTFSLCYLLVARAPPDAEVAVFDVKAAHRRVPVAPWQQPFNAMSWNGKTALNFCCQFGAASSSGLWGILADAFRSIYKFRFPTSDALNWVDDFIFWRYLNASGRFDITEEDIYAFAEHLGWPWSRKKTKLFSSRFNYIGFTWDITARTVEVTTEKRNKYLLVLQGWEAGKKVRQKEVQSVLGKLVHCSLVMVESRSRLPRISHFAAAFNDKEPWCTFRLPGAVADDIAWWRSELEKDFCGMDVRLLPEPIDIRLFVDASTDWGIGLTLGDQWDHWKLRAGWKTDGREIGWAEMVAVELGLRALVERGYSNAHIRLWSNNKGVVGALDAGKSRGVQSNRVLQRIVSLMLQHGIWLALDYVKSADNPADAPSRGEAPVGFTRHVHDFKLPFVLRDFVEKV